MRAAERDWRSWRLPEALLVLAFLLLCGFDLWHHQIWRDEMQPWLFARDSATIPDLFRNLHYEIHPRLWYMILYGVARISRNPAAMQVTHLVIIGSAIALFVFFCPIRFHLRALTVFGCFFVYEWGTISRNYALGVLFCFAFCALFPRRGKSWLLLAAILFLATQSNHYAALLAAALGGLQILEALMNPELRARIFAEKKADAALSLCLIYGGVLLAFWFGFPQHDVTRTNLAPALDWSDNIPRAFATLWEGFVPLDYPPFYDPGRGIPDYPPTTFQPIFGMFLFLGTVAFFWRSRLLLWAYLGGACMLLLLSSVNLAGAPRHAGHFFLWFLICIWLACCLPQSTVPPRFTPFKLSLFQQVILLSFLLLHIYCYASIRVDCYRHPFSCSKAVALYIRQHHLTGLPIIAYPDYAAIPVSGYLDEPIYYINADRWGSFVLEDNKRRFNLTPQDILHSVDQFAAQGNRDFLLLLNHPIQSSRDGQISQPNQIGNLREEASFYPALVRNEVYWLYRYKAASAPM